MPRVEGNERQGSRHAMKPWAMVRWLALLVCSLPALTPGLAYPVRDAAATSSGSATASYTYDRTVPNARPALTSNSRGGTAVGDQSTVAEALSIEQRGANLEHFEIVPAGGAFPPEAEFQALLDEIRVLGGGR